jgi:8-oxo-dGTP diphosphatase
VGHELGALLQRSARRTVRMIARVETGAMHAEWRGHERLPDAAEISTSAGYDDFWIEEGLIRRQRTVRHPLSFQAEEEVVPVTGARPSRQYPAQPIVGVGAVIVQDGNVVLVKRKYEPLAGQWSLPGGRLELGETLEAGLAREMLEETGLEVEVGPIVDVFDRILLDPERRVRYHYVLIDYLCRPVGGSLTHGSDVAAAEFVAPGDLERYRLTPKATSVIEKGIAIARTHAWETAGR